MRLAIAILLLSVGLPAQVRVKPHVTKQGRIVQPHVRTKPNRTRIDNYSTKGNRNPYTGKKGSKPVFKPPRVRR